MAQTSPFRTVPNSTRAMQNRSDRDQRIQDQNQLLYSGSNSTNSPSTNGPSSNLATQVPSGSSIGTDTTSTPANGNASGDSVLPPGANNVSPSQAEADLKSLLQSSGPELKTRTLTQTQALAKSLGLNYDIQIKTYEVKAAQANIRQARGAFDPTFHAEGSYEKINDPQNTQDFVATGGTPQQILNGQVPIFEESNEHLKLSLNGKLPTGTQYELKTQMDVLSNTLTQTSPLSLFSPQYQSFTGITIDQPLLRGFGTDVNLAEIRVAVINKLVSRYELQDQMLATVSQVLQSYNQLSYLTEELEAKKQDKELGVKLVEGRIKSLEKGQISSRELNRAESSLAEIIEDYTKAQIELINQEAILQSLISTQPEIGQFVYDPITPMGKPQLNQSVEELLVVALTHRPKYLVARSKVEQEKIKLVYAENQKWPQLDLKGTYGVNGLSATFANSYYKEVVPQGPQWTVGALFSIPIGNNEAEGKYQEIVARKAQALLALKQVELNTDLLIRKLVATIHANQDRLNAMRIFAKTAKNSFDQEETRLEKGLSTDLDVLKFHRDYTEALARERAAEADLNNSFVQLAEITGTLLDSVNVRMQP